MKRLFFVIVLIVTALAANAQNADKLYEEGKALYDKKEYVAAIAKLRPAAEKGHKKAQYRLARCYDKGHGVDEYNAEAFRWYKKSAEQGYYKAEYQMARSYIKGKGVAPDEKKALSWVKKSVSGKKHGAEMLEEIKKGAADGDKTDQRLLELLR